jgi:histidine triad (HIT) family protein
MSDFYCENVFSGKVNVKKIKETDNVLAYYHTKPMYPLHIAIVPKEHILTLSEASDELINEIFRIAKEIIKDLKLEESSYKVVVNGGSFQDSKHLHFHLVSGEKLNNE